MSTHPVVLVTGAGKGLGRAICELFRSKSYTVVATDYDLSLVDDLNNKEGYITTAIDVSSTSSCIAAASFIQEQCGRLDIIVNNAGIIGYFPTVEMDPEKIIYHYQVNTFGALRTTHACLDLLAASQGRVINISSESYRLRTPFQAYQSTKLALEGLSDVMRRELALLNVHVATIRPGAIKTDLFEAMLNIENPVPNGRLAAGFKRFVNGLASNTPKKVSTPPEMAELIYHAATDPKKKPHYEKNNMLALKIAAVLPSSVVDKMVGKLLK